MLFRKQGDGHLPATVTASAPPSAEQPDTGAASNSRTGQFHLLFDKLTVPLRMPGHILAQCKEAFLDAGAEELEVLVELYDTRHGYTVVRMAKTDDGLPPVLCEIHVDLYDEFEELTETITASQLPADNPSEAERQKLDEIWVAIYPVDQIVKTVADRVTSPNEKCPCGSQKKFKKCCGRYA